MTDAFFSWSGGKDSCLALHHARAEGYQVRRLLAMFDETGGTSRSHGLSPALMAAQADALGIPLVTANAGWEDYQAVFIEQLRQFASIGITHGLFGDIDLQAHREWEEQVCVKAGLVAVLPLWQRPRLELAREFLEMGYRAVVVTVDGRHLGPEFAGRLYDEAFLADLPAGVDACGENGEFHTFAFDGPLFAQPVPWQMEAIETIITPAQFGAAPYHIAKLRPGCD
jgi:uncharacterized protein (TIGR00290 family)